MIHDCFIYNGEARLLALRIDTLAEVVDRFVIVEATRTFTGRRKDLRFDGSVLAVGAERVRYIVADDLDSDPASPWLNETRQRNRLAAGFDTDTDERDLVLLSDIDEIPRPEAIAEFQPARYLSGLFHQRTYYYALNNQVFSPDGNPVWWKYARITTLANLRTWFKTMECLRSFRPTGPARGVMRLWNKLRTQPIPDAGWHFSYLMSAEQILEKLQSFSHQEYNTPAIANIDHISKVLASRGDLFSSAGAAVRGNFRVVPVDQSFPRSLQLRRKEYEDQVW